MVKFLLKLQIVYIISLKKKNMWIAVLYLLVLFDLFLSGLYITRIGPKRDFVKQIS